MNGEMLERLAVGTNFARVAFRQAGNLAKELLNRVIGLPELVINVAGVLPAKKLRLRVIVLSKASGSNVLGVPKDQVEAVLAPAIELTREILWREAKVRVLPAGGRFVDVESAPAPPTALSVHCNQRAFVEDFETAGRYFTERLVRTVAGSIAGIGAPVTAFVVAEIDQVVGCSIGPLADYVTLRPDGVTMTRPWALAHEIGHACGLPHVVGLGRVFGGHPATNLMDPFGSGELLTKRQAIVLRNSRHVTLL
ncbi:MAG: hypothetical protein L0221_09010 [Chloroflexi bacterium]|nr:hypothetical protein [Chloroflexota bacterium]